MKHIQVTCAIIEKRCNNNHAAGCTPANCLHNSSESHVLHVLAAQRSSIMSMPLKWEFPGGKIMPGESPEDCLKRELAEEMSIEIQIERALPLSTHDYPSFRITLHPFVCRIISGEIHLREHSSFLWLPPEKLFELDWAEADRPVLISYLSSLNLPVWKKTSTENPEHKTVQRE